MTLIVSYVRDDFVMQVSDRLLSLGNEPMPEEHNKAVVWCNMAVVAFTGFAYVDAAQRHSTDVWMMETLRGRKSHPDALNALADGARRLVSRVPWENKWLAFSMVGWTPQPSGELVPYAALVSNMHNAEGDPLTRWSREFSQLYGIDQGGFAFTTAGCPLTDQESLSLETELRQFTETKSHPAAIANSLRHFIRRVADRDPRVGKSLMVTCVPRALAGTPFLVSEYKGMPTPDAATFCYLEENGRVTEAFGPHFVCGSTAMTDLQVKYLNATGTDHRVSVTVHSL